MAVVKMRVSQYIKLTYAEGSRPSPNTIKARIDNGKLPGCREEGNGRSYYYVYVEEATNEPMAPPIEVTPVNRFASKLLPAGNFGK